MTKKYKIISAVTAAAILCSFAGCSIGGIDPLSAIQDIDSTSESPLGSAESQNKDEPDYKQIVTNIVKEFQFNGVVYISKNSIVIYNGAFGKIGDDDSDDVTPDTRYCIGSLSKQFAAVSIMMLKEEKKLSVDDTLDKYYPEYTIGKDITVKELLDMRSGIVNYRTVNDEILSQSDEDTDSELPYTVYSAADAYDNKLAIKEWIFNQPLNFEPDTNFECSDSNYLLLADIVEQVSGVDYHQYIQENIFDKLGMTKTTVIENKDTLTDLAQSSDDLGAWAYPGTAYGCCDIISTTGDLGKWMESLRENKLINAKSFYEMRRNYSPDETELGYGYAFTPMNTGIIDYGAFSSYVSFNYTDPRNNLDICAVTNHNSDMLGKIDEFSIKLINEILKKS